MEVKAMEKNLRVSSFIIPVKVDDKKYMLLHGYSGAMDIVDEDIFIKLKENTTISNITIPDELLNHLIKRKYITTLSHEEETSYQRRLAIALHKKDILTYSSYTFVVTYNCNFRCSYCFERDSINNQLRKYTMTRKVVDKAFSAITKMQSEKIRKTNYITLFGGEPLLKQNYDIVSYIVEQGVERGYKFKAITNGYDLSYFMDLLAPDKICALQITIDGMEEMHNNKRPHCLGVPTFNTIISNIKKALEKDVYVTVRFNTDKTNISQLNELNSYFSHLGYTKYKKFSVDSARLINYDDNMTDMQAKKFMTQKEFIKTHEDMNFEFGCHDFETYSKIYNAIHNNKPLPYTATFCSSQIGGCVFDPLYKIYPCWDLVGKEEYQIADFSGEEISWNEYKKEAWISNDVTKYKECNGCKCALLCGGGCMSQNFGKHHCTHMMDIIKYAAKKAYVNLNKFTQL